MMQLFQNQQGDGDSPAIDTSTANIVGVQVMGIMNKNARIHFEASVNGMQFFPVVAICPRQIISPDDVMSGLYRVDVSGLNHFRCRISDYQTGTINVFAQEQ